MKVVIPMAGRGSRFTEVGVKTPKPLIEVGGRPMVAWALESLVNIPYSKLIFIALREHNPSTILQNLGWPRTEIVLLDEVTEGPLCTVLAASDIIDDDEDLLIATSDTYVVSNLGYDIAARSASCQGIISVIMGVPGDRWSFVRTDEIGRVIGVAEKVRISDYVATGLYYFSNGKQFVEASRGVKKTHGEFYVIPVYQEYINRNWQVNVSIADEMWEMGTPETLKEFNDTYGDQTLYRNI